MGFLREGCGLILSAILFVLILSESGHCQWWSVARDGPYNSLQNNDSICDGMNGFTNFQKKWCKRKDSFMIFVSEGARKGISECQYQFRNHRWNCPTFNDSSGFGKLTDWDTREMAFVRAITAAGAVHSIARACQQGLLPKRRCPKPLVYSGAVLDWGENSPYASHASELLQDFINSQKRKKSSRKRQIMNIHNNNIGRMAVVRTSQTICECHGLKDSCDLKTCWKQVRDFRVVADELKKAYDRAIEVEQLKNGELVARRLMRKPTDSELIYLQASPNYCERNAERGILGTVGRECDVRTIGMHDCNIMCCGRGYKTTKFRVDEICNGSTTGKPEICSRIDIRHECN
uniref:protein Wnt-5-like isoform X2 n=1 Tax=Styela clava TaxID=7725 RepID=UPI00193A196A|nr:protein Wnt-5-like isoform X2 [Styela clava]